MPTKYTVTLTTLGTSSVVVLPKPVIDGFNLGKGSRLELIVRDDGIYIPLKEVLNESSVAKNPSNTTNEATEDA